MKVVRYTFDVCIRDGVNKDIYSMRSLIEASIMKCDGVCGCETVQKPEELGYYNVVDVNKAIEWQRSNKRWIGEKGGNHA